jgi:hypothetical protein
MTEVTSDLDLPELPDVSGYDTADRFFASRYRQGGRWVYNIDLSLSQLVSYIPAPDPDHPTDFNRKIRVAHAESFARYLRRNKNWVAPALLLRAPGNLFEFEPLRTIGGIEWGVLSVPRLARTDLKIVDGQHRTLGAHIAFQQLANELDAARSHLSRAKSGGEPAVIQAANARIRGLEEERKRLDKERLSLQIMIIEDVADYKQVFVDIADNALGITSAVKARFDSRKIVNRCLSDVLEHMVLRGHVDMDQDRILGNNPNLLSARHVVDIIRVLEVGIAGRITDRKEKELRESHLVNQTIEFFDVLVGSFDPLRRIAEGAGTVPDLRKSSLLGSTVMLRVLAGVYFELVKNKERTSGEVASFFNKLSSEMGAPVKSDSIWVRTKLFPTNSMAPTARRQDLKALVEHIVSWNNEPGVAQ